MKIHTVICPKCKEEIYSRAQHDFRKCSCGNIFIDGGFSYSRIGFTDKEPDYSEREIDITEEELYNDWNQGQNKYGKYN